MKKNWLTKYSDDIISDIIRKLLEMNYFEVKIKRGRYDERKREQLFFYELWDTDISHKQCLFQSPHIDEDQLLGQIYGIIEVANCYYREVLQNDFVAGAINAAQVLKSIEGTPGFSGYGN